MIALKGPGLLGRALTPGAAQGELALLSAPLSLWGGLELETGRISDVTHPQHGVSLAGRILAMTAARGSSSSSSALVEAIRRGTAPKAIILGQVDPILVIGSLVAADLYQVAVPIILLAADQWPQLVDGSRLVIETDGDQASLRSV